MAASMQFIYYLQDVGERYHQNELLDKIARVTKEDLRNVLARYLKRLFDPKKSNAVLCTASAKVQGIAEQFQGVSSRKMMVQQDFGKFFSAQ